MSASRSPRRRGRRAAALLLVPAVAVLVTACSGAGTDSRPSSPAASSAAPAPASAAAAPADPESDLCAFLPRDDIDVPMKAYGDSISSMRSGRRDGSPACTITTTGPAKSIVLLLAPQPFAEVEKRYTAGAPAEHDSVLLGPSEWFTGGSFAAAYGDRTLIVGATGRGSTPAYLVLMGTALDDLPAP